MENLLQLWQGWDWRRRAVVAGATLAIFLSILGLARMASTPGMALLYAGLEGKQAGEVVRALDATGVSYEVRGDSIYVDATRRDDLRMTLAADGLPGNTGGGYEILDGMTGFGTTSQMFDAAYWRAREGELARTIMANRQIHEARVHIAEAPSQPFQTGGQTTASVSVVTAAGGLSGDQARAIRHLVASAVPGLAPASVAVIDSVAGLIDGDLDDLDPASQGKDRASEIRANIERLLAARVGPGKAVVEVAVDTVTEKETISERKIDPQGRVAISTETIANTGTSTQGGGEVTVASNLPQGAGAGGGGKSENNESRERVNYELSETQREVLKTPGAIRKISVAVLVDGETITGEDGTVSKQPRSPEELQALGELVSSAAGLDPARGDVLTLKSMDFLPVPAGTEASGPSLLPPLGPINLMTILQMAVLAIVALVTGLFVLRPMLSRGGAAIGAEGAGGAGLLAGPMGGPALALPGPEGGYMANAPGMMTTVGTLAGTAPVMIGADGLPVLTGEIADEASVPADPPLDPMERLRRLIAERQTESVEILRGWMENQEEKA